MSFGPEPRPNEVGPASIQPLLSHRGCIVGLVKGNVRRRENRDGSVSYLCQVYAGRDPATGRKRYKTAVAKNERQAHKLVHQLIADVESAEQTANSGTALTLSQLIDTWMETGGPAGEATRNDYLGYVK